MFVVTDKHVEKSEFHLESHNPSLHLSLLPLPPSSLLIIICYFPHPSLPVFTLLALKGGNLHFCTSSSSSSKLGMKWFTVWRERERDRKRERERERERERGWVVYTSALFPFSSVFLLLASWSDLHRLFSSYLSVCLLPPPVLHCYCDGSQDCYDHLNSFAHGCW